MPRSLEKDQMLPQRCQGSEIVRALSKQPSHHPARKLSAEAGQGQHQKMQLVGGLVKVHDNS